MDFKIENTLENYRERVQRLGLFDCLYKLDQKKKKDNKGNPIDYYSLGLLTLLFFFENMLSRNSKTGVKELAIYFKEVNRGEIDVDDIEFESIARTVVEVLRPAGGKRYTKEFYNWDTRQIDKIEYAYLKASKSDIQTNTQYYTLAEHGLELVFATKEYYSEFQLSINQLLLRKQLEKGEFAGAIRQIDEMRIDVEALEERIIKIKHEVQRNILSEVTYKRYKDLIEDIRLRLNRESDEFDELIAFVNQTRETLSYEVKNEKEIKAYNYIIIIQKELGEVHRNHTKLLQKSIELKTSTLQAAQEALYYVGIENFNFKKEIVSRLFASPLPINSTVSLIKPFLYLEKMEVWSPLTVFAPQRIYNKEKEAKSGDFLQKKSENETQKEKAYLQAQILEISDILAVAMKNQTEITLEKLVEWMVANERAHWLEESLFYHFFIILHQKSPIKLRNKNQESETFLKPVIDKLSAKYKLLNVVELNQKLKINSRYTISNFKINLERVDNDV